MAVGRSMPAPVKFVITPLGVIRPIESDSLFVNHSAPSGPAVISPGASVVPPPKPRLESVKLCEDPLIAIRPIELEFVNHNAPSGPPAIADGELMPVSW